MDDTSDDSSFGLSDFLRDAGSLYGTYTAAEIAKSQAQNTQTAVANTNAVTAAQSQQAANNQALLQKVLYIGGGLLVLVLVIVLIKKK